jgi:hypothetical protein
MTLVPVPVGWDVDHAARLYRDGWTLRQIARKFGIAWSAVHTQLVAFGVEMRQKRKPLGRPDVDTEEIIYLREEVGCTWPEIAAEVRMTQSGVVSRYRRATRANFDVPDTDP